MDSATWHTDVFVWAYFLVPLAGVTLYVGKKPDRIRYKGLFFAAAVVLGYVCPFIALFPAGVVLNLVGLDDPLVILIISCAALLIVPYYSTKFLHAFFVMVGDESPR